MPKKKKLFEICQFSPPHQGKGEIPTPRKALKIQFPTPQAQKIVKSPGCALMKPSVYHTITHLESVATWPRTDGSIGQASGCNAGGCELESGQTNTQGLKITELKVLPL